jgi:uncharacterized protein YhaN
VEVLRKITETRQKTEAANRRLAGIDRDLDTFRIAVQALAGEFCPDRADGPAEQIAVHLHTVLQEARRQADRHSSLQEQQEKLEGQSRDAEANRRSMAERLAQLRNEAGCADDSELEESERHSIEVRDLRRELDRCERQLLQEGEGSSLDDLEREAEGIDADAFPGLIEQLDRNIEEREGQLGDLREELGRVQRELEHHVGGDAAAEAAGHSQEILARLRADIDRYVRIRLAASLLKREVEKYRTETKPLSCLAPENSSPSSRPAASLGSKRTLTTATSPSSWASAVWARRSKSVA